jgi:hypothetical protein
LICTARGGVGRQNRRKSGWLSNIRDVLVDLLVLFEPWIDEMILPPPPMGQDPLTQIPFPDTNFDRLTQEPKLIQELRDIASRLHFATGSGSVPSSVFFNQSRALSGYLCTLLLTKKGRVGIFSEHLNFKRKKWF